MGQIDSKQLAREIQKAFDESLSISSGSARQLIVSDTKPAASQLPVIDQLEAVKYIQNYLEGVYSRIEGSEFKLILSLRRILAANDVDSSETLKREAEHTGRLVHSMLHGLNRLKEKI